MSPAQRISIRELRGSELFRREEMVEESTGVEEEQDEAVEWELARVRFIQRIVEAVATLHFLTPFLDTAFRFYINKVLLYFLTRETLQAYHTYDDHNPTLQAQLADLHRTVTLQLAFQYQQLVSSHHLWEPIERF